MTGVLAQWVRCMVLHWVVQTWSLLSSKVLTIVYHKVGGSR